MLIFCTHKFVLSVFPCSRTMPEELSNQVIHPTLWLQWADLSERVFPLAWYVQTSAASTIWRKLQSCYPINKLPIMNPVHTAQQTHRKLTTRGSSGGILTHVCFTLGGWTMNILILLYKRTPNRYWTYKSKHREACRHHSLIHFVGCDSIMIERKTIYTHTNKLSCFTITIIINPLKQECLQWTRNSWWCNLFFAQIDSELRLLKPRTYTNAWFGLAVLPRELARKICK